MESTSKLVHSKKLYETVLTNESGEEAKREAIVGIIKMAVSDHSHFSFLLNQVDWFCPANLPLMPLLAKVVRAYRGTSKSASKVIFNLLASALCIPQVNILVVDLLVNIIHTFKDNIIAIDCLRENYPHKVCPSQMHNTYVDSLLQLCRVLPSQRFNLMSIVVENMAAFDTEMALGDAYASKLVFQDDSVLELGQQCEAFQLKYDSVLARVVSFVGGFTTEEKETLLKQFYLIFQKIMMTVDNMKMIQYVAFYLAQASLQNAYCFVAMLLNTIIENYGHKDNKKIYIAALQYLRSYAARSLILPEKSVRKIFTSLLSQLQEKLSDIQVVKYEELNLSQFGEQNAFILYLTETLLFMKWKFPFIGKSPQIIQKYNTVIEQAKNKIHFQTFLDSNLLTLTDKQQPKPKNTPKSFTTLYIDRFLPVFLPQTQKLIKMNLKITQRRMRPAWSMQESTEIQQIGGLVCRKMVSGQSFGGQTPLTFQEYSN